MKIKLLQVGKTQSDYLTEGISLFEQRLRNYISFSSEIIPSLKLPATTPAPVIKQKEGELILGKFRQDDRVILLDERGKTFSSIEFSEFLSRQMNLGTKNLVFVVGGAYGFSDAVYEKAFMKLSLSTMTFSHQLIRLIFMEQIYRAFTILNNHPYHNE